MVVGPGLGKDPLMVRTVGSWLEHAASREKPAPVVLDGDGIHVLLEHPHLVQSKLVQHLVLTPNAAEFRRLWEKFVDKNPPPFDVDTDGQWLTDSRSHFACTRLSRGRAADFASSRELMRI